MRTLGVLLACGLTTLVSAQPLDYTACELSYPVPGDPRREGFNELLEAARTREVDALVLGSSIYTLSGNGGYLITALNAEFAEIYGNVPATTWMPVGNFGTSPPAQLGARGAKSSGSAAPTGYDSTYGTPNFPVYKFTTWNGNVLQLEPDTWSAVPNEYGRKTSYYRTGSSQYYRPEWICTSHGGVSTEGSSATTFGWQVRKRLYTPGSGAGGGAIFSGGTSLTAVTSVNIPSVDLNGRTVTPNSSTFDAWRLGCPATNGASPATYAHDASAPYYNFTLEHGSGSGQFFAVAQRWVNTTTTKGLVVSSMSKSGCKMDQIISDHGNSGPILRAVRPEIVIIALHTNSAGNNYAAYDPEDEGNSYYHMGLALIDWIRTYVPNCWIVLIPDGPRTDLTAGQTTEYGLMVGAHQMLVDARPNVLAINLTLSLARAGYTPANETITGYTFRGLWTTATSYSVGDVVSLDGGGEVRYAECIQANTSGSTTKPFLSASSSDYWRQRRSFIVSNPDPTASPNTYDYVHPGGRGSTATARHIVKLMTEGLYSRPKSPRGRRERRKRVGVC